MQKLQTVNADTLLYEPLEKPSFVVDGLIPTGLTLFCGAQGGMDWNCNGITGRSGGNRDSGECLDKMDERVPP